ncbi:MAG: hypothetical protein ABFQ65_03840 [Nanoarchaeota archaeon]
MAEKRSYEEETQIRFDRYLFRIRSNERYLIFLEDWGEMPDNFLTQRIFIENIDNPFRSEKNLIHKTFFLEEVNTTDESKDYAPLKHKQLVNKMAHAPWRYLRKIKRKN